MGAFVLRRSSKTWFDNVFQVKYVNRYLWNRIMSIQEHGQDVAWARRKVIMTKDKVITKPCRKASARQQKRGTDLKMKRQIRPRRITIELLANVKGMDVIVHGLCPLPINRWIVLPYCSRGLDIRSTSRLYSYFPSRRRYICNLLLLIQVT